VISSSVSSPADLYFRSSPTFASPTDDNRSLYRHRILLTNSTFYIARNMDRVSNNDANNRRRRSNNRRRSNQPRRRNVTAAGVDTDYEAELWGDRSTILKKISIPGQSVYGRRQLAHDLKRLGFLDTSIYPTVFTFLVSLPALYCNSDLLFVLDPKVFNFLCKAWNEEDRDEFDFILLKRIHSAIVQRVNKTRGNNQPTFPGSLYRRDPNVVTSW